MFHIPLAHHIAEKDAACAGGTKAEYSAEISDNDHKGIGGHRIGTHVPQNHRVHGEGNAPGDVVAKGRQGQPDKILKQKSVAQEHIAEFQLDILAEHGYYDTADQFDDPGQGGGDGHAGGAKLRGAEKPEDKHGIQKYIQGESHHI